MSARRIDRRPGFTLVEMLIVLAMIALLVSLALPRYFASLDHAKELVLQENLKILRLSIDRFFADKGRHPDSLAELVEQHYLRMVPLDPLTDSNGSWATITAPDADGIVDVKSGADGTTQDGRRYDAL